MFPLNLYARVRIFQSIKCTRDRGCSAHPVFPAPSLEGRVRPLSFGGNDCKPRTTRCRENAEVCVQPSSSAKADDPVFQGADDGIEKPHSAFADMTTFSGAALIVSTYAGAYGSLRSQRRRRLAIAGITNPIPAPGWRCRRRSGPASTRPCLRRPRCDRPDCIRPCRRDSRCPSGSDRGRTRRSGTRAGDN